MKVQRKRNIYLPAGRSVRNQLVMANVFNIDLKYGSVGLSPRNRLLKLHQRLSGIAFEKLTEVRWIFESQVEPNFFTAFASEYGHTLCLKH